MHDSSRHLPHRHRNIGATKPWAGDEASSANLTRRKRSKQVENHLKRHEGEDHSLEDEANDNIANFVPALSVIDTGRKPTDKLNGKEKLAIAPLEAQGQTGLSITLVSQGTAVAPLPTSTPQAISPRPVAMAAGAGSAPLNVTQAGSGGGAAKANPKSTMEMSDVAWPIAVGVMFAVLVMVSLL